MLINLRNGILYDEIDFKSYSIENIETTPIDKTTKSINIKDENNNRKNIRTMENLNMNLSLDEYYYFKELLTIQEHFNYMNSTPRKIKSKLLKR